MGKDRRAQEREAQGSSAIDSKEEPEEVAMSIRKALTIGGGLALLVWAVSGLLAHAGDDWQTLFDYFRGAIAYPEKPARAVTGGGGGGW